MKVTDREKLMLIFLLIIGLLGGGYYLVYKPAIAAAETQNIEYTTLSDQKNLLDAQIAGIDKMSSDVESQNESINQLTVNYYPSIIQEKMILSVNELIAGSGVRVSSVTYAKSAGYTPQLAAAAVTAASTPIPDVAAEQTDTAAVTSTDTQTQVQGGSLGDMATQYQQIAGEAAQDEVSASSDLANMDQAALTAALQSVQRLTVTIQFAGSYDQVRTIISMMENMNRVIRVSSISYSTVEGGSIEGSIIMDFCAIPKLTVQDSDYLTWK